MTTIPFPSSAPALDVDRYRASRLQVIEIQHRILDTVGKDALDACARKLGLLSHGRLAIQSESELSLMAEYCVFDYRACDGRTALQRYFRNHPTPPGHPDHAAAAAMLAAVYRVVRIDRCIRDVGIEVTDMLTAGTLTINDISLGRCKAEGGMLATRTVDLEEMTVTTGAAVPLWPETIAELLEMANCRTGPRSARVEGDPMRDPAEFSATVIKAAIRSGSTRGVRFQDVH